MKDGPARAAGGRGARPRQRPKVARSRLEAEASRAAVRAASGRATRAADLSPTAPARSLGGTGEALPAGVRDRLERLFDADLAAVRVHTGPAAARHAGDTRALAAGASVYLGASESASAAASFPVLAHEVAHVLQQTGELADDGRLVARPAAGSADPLAWEAPFESTPNPASTEDLLVGWAALARLRGETTAAALIDALEAGHAAAPDPVIFWNTRGTLVIAGGADPAFALPGQPAPRLADLPPLARSALFDGLKRNGHSVAAAHLLRAHEDTESALRDPDTYTAYVDLVGVPHLLDRILHIWDTLPLLEEARPNKAMAISAAWLLGSYDNVPRTPIHDDRAPSRRTFLAEDLPEVLEAAVDAFALYPNELVLSALRAIVDLESYRITQLQPPPDGARLVVSLDPRINERVTIASRLAAWADDVSDRAAAIEAGTAPSFGGTREARHLVVRDLAPALGALGAFAVDHWEAGALADSAASGERLEEAAARGLDAETLRGIAASFPELDSDEATSLRKPAQAFFARAGDGALPEPQVYAGRVDAYARALGAIERRIQARVIRQINRAWNVPGRPLAFDASRIPTERSPLLAQAAWLVATLGGHSTQLESYSREEDDAFAARWGRKVASLEPPVSSWPGDDLRVIHRGRLARGLLDVASTAGLTGIADLVRPIVEATESWAEDAEQTRDVLAIAAPFGPQPSSPISRLADDQSGPIEGWEQFSIQQIVIFFQGDHYRRLSAQISQLLGGAEGSRFELDQVPILNQAQTAAVESDAHPLRHAVGPDDFIYLHRPPPPEPETGAAPPTPAAREPLRKLIKQHPITRHTVRAWPLVLIPSNQSDPDLVLWRLPQPVGLARYLRTIPEVNHLLAGYALVQDPDAAPTATQFADPVFMPDAMWWEWWVALTQEGALDVTAERRLALREALRAGGLATMLSTERTEAWDQLWDRQREALVHERERTVRTRVEPLLEAHDATARSVEHTRVHGRRVRKRSAAQAALEELQSHFLYQVDDEQERAAHQAAAVLRVAYLLRDELAEEDDGTWVLRGWDRDVAYWWLPVLEEVFERCDLAPAPDADVLDEPKAPLDAWLRDDERPASSWVPPRLAALENVYDAMIASLEEHQQEFGFVAVAGDGTIENPGLVYEVDGSAAHGFGPGHPFTIDGVTWEVIAVPEAFTYHPAVQRRGGVEIKPAMLVIDGEVVPFDGERTLLRVDRDGEYVEIKNDAAGDVVLRELAFAVMMATTVEQLVGLATTIEEGAMFVVGLALDIAELFPVAGQAAAAARVVFGVGAVLADDDFRELIGALIVDPAAMLEQAWSRVTTDLSAARIVEAMLVDPGLERLEALAKIEPGRRRRTGRTTSRVGRILRRLSSIGRGVAGSLGRVIDKAHDGRDDLQATVLEQQLLGRALDLVAEHIYFLTSLPEAMAAVGAVPDDATDSVRERFEEIVGTVGEMRLPAKLIELDDVVAIFLDIVGRRLGGKYRIGYVVIRALLEAVGRWDEVVGLISDGIEKLIGDPTDELGAWSSFVNTRIGPHVRGAQLELHEILATIYGALPGVTDELAAPPPLNLSLEGEQFLDAQPQLRPGAVRAPLPERLDLTGGRPLTPAERARFEGQLGQDLAHVRVHTGSLAARATGAAGARALTTGSHVVLAADVRPEAESGQRVLRHELVHVLQQTGPRRPGDADGRPVAGQPGLGLRIDPRAEAIAEDIAARAGGGPIAPVPGEGVQPDLLGTGQRFIDYLLHAERARPEAARIEETGASTGRQLIGREVRADVRRVGSAIARWIQRFGQGDIELSKRDTFGPARADIKAWLRSRQTVITDAIEDLAIDASETTRRRSDARESRVTELEEESFERKLQRFVTVATGCTIDFELRRTARGRLDRRGPLRSATFVNLNLALVPYEGAGAALWDRMMRNTFFAPARNSVHVRTHARILLFAAGGGDAVWDSDGFKLKDRLAGQIRREGQDAAAISLLPAEAFWYGSGPRPSDERQPALWIGKHEDATHHGMTDRQSHHTTQYLLVQYFEQAHALEPFPNLSRPEVAAIFTGPLRFSLHLGKVMRVGDIKVGELDPLSSQRGGKMPAILMASVTHRRGRLHMAPYVRDSGSDDPDSDPTPATQGGAVHDAFQRGLDGALPPDVSEEYWATVAALSGSPSTSVLTHDQALAWLRLHAAALATAIPHAMKFAYAEMRSKMLDAIEPALRYLEVTWYEELAHARGHSTAPGSPHHVTDAMVRNVAEAAEANNQTIMEKESKWASTTS